MFCTKCGKKLKEGALFCTQCGANASRRLYVAPNPIVKPQPVVEEKEIISQTIEQQQVVEVQPDLVLEQEKREPVNHVGICPHCGMTVTLYPVYEQPTQPAYIKSAVRQESVPAVKTRFSILSIIGFSLSMVATLLIFFSHYIVYIIGIACAISSLVVSIIGTIRASKNGQQLKVLGILGIAFGIATTIYYTYIWIVVLTILSGFGII